MFSASRTHDLSSCSRHENTDSPLFSLRCNASYYSKINIKTLDRRDIFTHLMKVLDSIFVELNEIKCSAPEYCMQGIGLEKWIRTIGSVHNTVERVLSSLKNIVDATHSELLEATSLTGVRDILSPLVVGALFKIHVAYHALFFMGSVPSTNNYTMIRVANVILSLSHVTNVVFTLPLSPVPNTTEYDNAFFNTAAVSSHTISASLYHLENVVQQDSADIILACNMLIKSTSELLSPHAPKNTIESLRLCSAITANAAGIIARNTCNAQVQSSSLSHAASIIKHTIISAACVHVDIMRGCSQCKSTISEVHHYATDEVLNDHAEKVRISSEVSYLRNSLHLYLCDMLNPRYIGTIVALDPSGSDPQNHSDTTHYYVHSNAFTINIPVNSIPSTTLTHVNSTEHTGTSTHNSPAVP